MINVQDNWAVGMVSQLCPCCLKKQEMIVIPKYLTPKAKQEIEEAHGKVIGFSDLCEECQTTHNKGYIYVIEIDPEKSNSSAKGNVKLEEVYRTGKAVWIKKEVLLNVFGNIPTNPFLLVEQGMLAHIGLTDEVLEDFKREQEKSKQSISDETS